MIYRITTLVIAFIVTIIVFMPLTLIAYFIIQIFHSIYLTTRFLKKRT